MAPAEPLAAESLRRTTDVASLGFATTADLDDLDDIVGQERAVEAVEFAIGIRREGYNLYALGPAGIGKHTVLRQFLERQAADEAVPPDWVYVIDFAHPQVPRALRLPPGLGTELRDGMSHLVVELRRAIPAAFETDAYRKHREAIEDDLRRRRDELLSDFEARAKASGVVLIRTAVGMGLAAVQGSEVLGSEAVEGLPEPDRQRIRQATATFEEELQGIVRRVRGWEREQRE